MVVAGIVAEYNPFHNGHLHHLTETKRHADAVVAVMSGNFVQRAECALFDRHERAACAVKNGVDLVLGMPVGTSVGTADDFARGAIRMLDGLGIVDLLSFGCECGDLGVLNRLVALRERAEADGSIAERMREGKTFARAESEAMAEYGTDLAADRPNDVLALAYLRALRALGSPIRPLAVSRIGSYHGDCPVEAFLNATAIRQRIRNGDGVSDYVPRETLPYLQGETASMQYLERSILDTYRRTEPSVFHTCYGMREGLENRICSVAREVCSLQELYETVKTKRYPMSAVRRAVLGGYLRLPAVAELPPYLHILACNDTGRELLRLAKKRASLPLVQVLTPQMMRDSVMGPSVLREVCADDCFALALPSVRPAGRTLRQNTIYISK